MTDAQVLSALSWWREAGVDILADEAPRDWLRAAPPPPAPAAVETPAPAPVFPATLAAFQESLRTGAPSASLHPAGDAASGLMLLGDIPDSGDIAAGQLYSGDVGRLFDRMLGAIGRDRASIYLAPLSVTRPEGRTLDAATSSAILRLARHHVALAAPRHLILLGARPVRLMLGMEIAQARGRVHEIDLDGVPTRAIATYDPPTLFQQPTLKAHAWADLRLLLEETA
jgi:uracil-DNA glycosylase family 4